jgi:hypothetical protein
MPHSTTHGRPVMKIIMVHNTYREAGGEDVVFENEKRLLQRSGHISSPLRVIVPQVRSNLKLKTQFDVRGVGT